MDQTLLIYTEQGTTEPSESIEEELVLPHLRVRFQDETSSEVSRLHVRSRKKYISIYFHDVYIFFSGSCNPRWTWRFAPWAQSWR